MMMTIHGRNLMTLRQFGAAAAVAVTLAFAAAAPAHAVTEIQWWHAMTGGNNDVVNKLAADFNASQTNTRWCHPTRAAIPTP
jgi:sn-glycerol 3-phosphate transport system substrate-binding protein